MTPELPRPGPAPGLKDAFTCGKTDTGSTPRRLWRLTGSQYRNTLAVAFMGQRHKWGQRPPALNFDPIVPFDPPNSADRFSNLAWSYAMGDGEMRLAIQASKDLATRLVAAAKADNRPCLGKKPLGDCVKELVTARGAILFRRPLTADEVTEFVQMATANQVMLGDDRAVAMVFQSLLMSPHFLFRLEQGSSAADPSGATRLTPFELASALSFALTDFPPDDDLWKAAEANTLGTPEQIRAQVERLIGVTDPIAAKDNTPAFSLFENRPINRFFSEYVPYKNVHQVFKDPKYKFHVPEKLEDETAALVKDVLSTNGRNDFLKTLLTSADGFIHGDVLGSYNLDKILTQDQFCKNTGDHNCANRHRLTFPMGQRAGLLTQPAFLVAFSKPEETEPVQRGRFIAESLLCRTVPDLPIGEVPVLPDLGPSTMRDRLSHHSIEPRCSGCHQMMDSMGLALEIYDHLGRYREVESAKTIDSAGVLSGSENQDGAFKNAVDLMARLGSSSLVSQCFVRHSFAYWLGRQDGVGDGCALVAAQAAFSKTGDYVELLASFFTSRPFLYRRIEK